MFRVVGLALAIIVLQSLMADVFAAFEDALLAFFDALSALFHALESSATEIQNT
jgi:hypothetical protein